ncbi:hypothetical protein [Amycolatopsis anabasis]|uniref:hypothetical protein n=1 Tax=Amycolatopsis anabasis TaxID=1840409 RepID=UPI00131E8912|nr:hypothetical protein [Amycolatopsis anabasis]
MRRHLRVIGLLGAALALTAACGQARAGAALPDGEDAATYVSAKFESALNRLQESLGEQRDTTASNDTYFRFDEKWAHNTIVSARLGSPESRVTHNRSEKNPDEFLDSFSPADGDRQFVYLGPVYKNVAPTAWVSLPKTDGRAAPACAWAGILPACKMANAVAITFNTNKKAATNARSRQGGRTELRADVTLDAFLRARVEVLPDSVLGQITDTMRKQIVPTTITLDPGGALEQILMEANISAEGHRIELREEFHFTGKASPNDFPKLPDAAQITVLPDQAAVDDFYRRLDQARTG